MPGSQLPGGQLSYLALSFATIDPNVITWGGGGGGVNCRGVNGRGSIVGGQLSGGGSIVVLLALGFKGGGGGSIVGGQLSEVNRRGTLFFTLSRKYWVMRTQFVTLRL